MEIIDSYGKTCEVTDLQKAIAQAGNFKNFIVADDERNEVYEERAPPTSLEEN